MVGKVAPEIAKAAPASEMEFTVTAALPEAVRVSVLFEMVLIFTLPKSRLLALNIN